MKNLIVIAAALALTACKYENSTSQYPYYQQMWYETVSASETVRTTNTWSSVAGVPQITAVEQTRNGAPVYRDSGFEYASTVNGNPTQFTRTISLPEPATELHKNTYSDDRGIQLSSEIFRNGETSPSSWMKRTLDGSGRISRQESFDSGVRTVFSNYTYGASGYTIKYDSAVSDIEGATVNTSVQELYNNNERNTLVQREVFSGENRVEIELWNTTDGSYKKYVGQNIVVSGDGSTLSGELLVVDLGAITATPGANESTTQTQSRKEYDPETGRFIREVTVRSYWQLVYIKL